MNNQEDIQAVKNLGERIGYGHLMELASAIWRKKLIDAGGHPSGAFVPTLIFSIREEDKKFTKKTMDYYDKIVLTNE